MSETSYVRSNAFLSDYFARCCISMQRLSREKLPHRISGDAITRSGDWLASWLAEG